MVEKTAGNLKHLLNLSVFSLVTSSKNITNDSFFPMIQTVRSKF